MMPSPAQFVDNPAWYAFLPEMTGAPRERHLPSHEDCTPLDVEKVAMHLRRGGTLGALPGYEERPGQLEMLKAIVRAFNAREHLMIEAGTGVGKSLAYLVPSILWAATNETTVIVSTATRNLQSQLMDADIPRALGVLGERAKTFRVALLKGRGNYLCLRAVSEFFAPGYWTMSEEQQAEMPKFIRWLQTTPDGDLDDYEGLPRTILTCPGEECGGRRCFFYSRCFLYRMRRCANEAHLVVVNHSLVLAEAGGGNLLPPSARLVLDEAHNLEAIATEQLSVEFSLPALLRLLNVLRRKPRGRQVRPSGVLAAVLRQLQRGAWASSSAAKALHSLVSRAPQVMARVVTRAENLLAFLERLLAPAGNDGPLRYRVQERRSYALNGLFHEYEESVWCEAEMLGAYAAFENELAALVNLLHELRTALEAVVAEEEVALGADLAVQVGSAAESLVAFANEANFTLRGVKPTHVYWVERVRPQHHAPYLRLVAAPLTVADELRELLYRPKDSVVLSSATLRVGADFKYMAHRLGCDCLAPGEGAPAAAASEGSSRQDYRFRAMTASSPFDYLRQSLALALDSLPAPSTAGYARTLGEMLVPLFEEMRGRALVLFTSYEMMKGVAAQIRPTLEARGFELLVQGEGVSREAMTARLRETSGERNGGTVLFGSQSFWEGVDVAGQALSCVVIARLPFPQVGDPIVAARSERIDREGGSSFRDYTLPEAVIKFRQGFGRLIRSKADRGVVVVADPRLVTKSYGAVFRRSIPTSFHTVVDAEDLLARVRAFFAVDWE